jgi:single-strand DNA-binding protein
VNGIEITVVGNLSRDFELRYTAGGRAVASSSIASARRFKKADSQEWEEVTSWVNVTCWAEMAEHATQSLPKGTRVIVQGRFEEREYTDKEGNPRKVWDLTADEIGPSLRWATVEVTRTERTKAGDEPRQQSRQEPMPNDPGEEPFS